MILISVDMAKYSDELKTTARNLFIKGWTIPEISKETGINERTLYNWRESDNWELFAAPDTVEQAIARRINVLAERDNKTPGELDEMARLVSVFGDLRINIAKAEQLMASARLLDKGGYIPPDLLPNAPSQHDLNKASGKARGNKKSKKKTVKNDISSITIEMLDEVRNALFFKYQILWYEAKIDPITRRTRFILKSRQIGATFYFAFEALDDAIRTGDNQIFLSASRDQAEVFKAYIIAFAAEHLNAELSGQGVITLSNGAELRFLSTNSRTAQSYHGHLYIDEVFWIPGFEKMWKVASGMAAHKKWRRTLFSTPSAMSHEAYPMWCGDKYNKNKAESKQVEFDLSHKTLLAGSIGVDKIWRNSITVKDAEKQGCDLFDIDELQIEYSVDDFANLFMCKFIDDAKSVFNLAKLMACMVDTDTWKDYHENAARPFGSRPVALGYDPARTRDNASLATVSIPLDANKEPWRLLKKESYNGVNFQFQANRIKEKCNQFNVKHIGIDVTGIGFGVFELVEPFFRRATPINYSIPMKTELVLKALQLIENGQFQYSAGDKEVTQAFLMITKTTSPSGQITYAANRSNATGHADVAWAIMHAFNYEKIAPRKKTSASFSD